MSIGTVPFDLAAAIGAASTPNGVTGFRMFWNGWAACLARLGAGGRPPASVEIFSGVPFVWLRRRDTLRQAVSFWRATTPRDQFRLPEDPATPVNAPKFDGPAIRRFVKLVECQDANWGRWFLEHGIQPLEVAYEDLDRDPVVTVGTVLGHIGVCPDVAPVQPGVKRQADWLTEQYVEEYRRFGRFQM